MWTIGCNNKLKYVHRFCLLVVFFSEHRDNEYNYVLDRQNKKKKKFKRV